MIFGPFDWLIVAGLLLVALWGLWALLRWVWPAATDTTAGKTVGTVVDVTQQWTVKAALYALREYDPIEADPKAIEAWNYLWGVAVKGKPPKALVMTAVLTAGEWTEAKPPTIQSSATAAEPEPATPLQPTEAVAAPVPSAADEHAETVEYEPEGGAA